MARNFPRWEDTHWDYEKGNLNEDAKRYAVQAGRRVKEQGGVIHYFLVGQALEQETALLFWNASQVDDLALSEKLHGSCLERLRMPCQGQARSFGGGHPDVAAETGPPAEKTRGQFRNGFRQEIAHWQGGTGRFALVQPRPPRPVPARPERFRQTRKPRPF